VVVSGRGPIVFREPSNPCPHGKSVKGPHKLVQILSGLEKWTFNRWWWWWSWSWYVVFLCFFYRNFYHLYSLKLINVAQFASVLLSNACSWCCSCVKNCGIRVDVNNPLTVNVSCSNNCQTRFGSLAVNWKLLVGGTFPSQPYTEYGSSLSSIADIGTTFRSSSIRNGVLTLNRHSWYRPAVIHCYVLPSKKTHDVYVII